MEFRTPERFVEWLSTNKHIDKLGHAYRYHPRSDGHSKALCAFVLSDLLDACPLLEEHGIKGKIAFGINYAHTWQGSKKPKTIDLAVGTVIDPAAASLPAVAVNLLLGTPAAKLASTVSAPKARIMEARLDAVLVSCEAKAVMTEHGKSQPRLFDELSSSHAIVHAGSANAIAAGITVVNAATRFTSPLRQRTGEPIEVTSHRQPEAAARMVKHLRDLEIRDSVGAVGFDAYSTFVIDCDNVHPAVLVTELPAPQPADPDYYDSFIKRIARFYAERFSTL